MNLKSVSALLLIIPILSTSLLPIFPKRAEAIIPGVPTIVIDPAHIAETVINNARTFADMLARAAAQAILQNMINSTVNWARSGFQGGPVYVTNPKQFFGNLADGIAGEFISGTDLDFLCSPFQAQIRIALVQRYYQPARFQCTLTGVVGNIEGFLGDFNQGGWDAWFSMTQNSANNPYGEFIDAQVELDRRITNKLGVESQQLDWNQGFLSFASCARSDPETGECLEQGPVKTPGAIIKSQLDRVLPANMERFINAQHLEDLVTAFVTGALNRYVFGGSLF